VIIRIPPRSAAVLTQEGLRVTGEGGHSAVHEKTKAIKDVLPAAQQRVWHNAISRLAVARHPTAAASLPTRCRPSTTDQQLKRALRDGAMLRAQTPSHLCARIVMQDILRQAPYFCAKSFSSGS